MIDFPQIHSSTLPERFCLGVALTGAILLAVAAIYLML
jgi:hypothetical protein